MSKYDRQATQTGCGMATAGMILIFIGVFITYQFTPTVGEIANGNGQGIASSAIIGGGMAIFGLLLLMVGNAINPNNHN